MGIRDEFRQELQTAQVGGRRAMESRVSMPIAVFLAMALKDKIHRMFRNRKTDGCRRSSMTHQVPKVRQSAPSHTCMRFCPPFPACTVQYRLAFLVSGGKPCRRSSDSEAG